MRSDDNDDDEGKREVHAPHPRSRRLKKPPLRGLPFASTNVTGDAKRKAGKGKGRGTKGKRSVTWMARPNIIAGIFLSFFPSRLLKKPFEIRVTDDEGEKVAVRIDKASKEDQDVSDIWLSVPLIP